MKYSFQKGDHVRDQLDRLGIVLEVLEGPMEGYFEVQIIEGEYDGRIWPFVGAALRKVERK